jgi:AAA family ATP:ADP antiporter
MALSNKILKIIDVEVSESRLLVLLVIQSLFIGGFYGFLDIAANSLFLNVISAKELPVAFIFSGFIGIVLTSVFTFLQKKINYSKLAIINLIIIVLLSLTTLLGYKVFSDKFYAFYVWVIMGPLNIIAMIGFWGTASRIFNLRHGQRLFRLVDAGIVLGVVGSCYSIPVILSLYFGLFTILVLSFACIILALVIQLIISSQTDRLKTKSIKISDDNVEHGKSAIMKTRLIRLMSVFVALSTISAVFINYFFLAESNIKYPELLDLAMFFSVFTGTVMSITFVLKTFVYAKFIRNYGLQISLIFSPVVIFVFSVSALFAYNYSISNSGSFAIVLFFLILTLTRLLSISLRKSAEESSFRKLYQSISPIARHDIQAKVNGIMNEISVFIAGILLVAIGLLSFSINLYFILITVIAIWAYIAFRLFGSYKNYLATYLEELQANDRPQYVKTNTGIASDALKGNEREERIIFVLNMQEKIQPIVYERLIPYFLHHKLNAIKKYALVQSQKLHIYEVLSTLHDVTDINLQTVKESLATELKYELIEGKSTERIIELSRSKLSDERELAARLIGESKDIDHTNNLKFLLRDIEPNVKIAAIKASANIKNSELCPLMIEFLENYTYGNYACDTLIDIGEQALPYLEQALNKSGSNPIMIRRLIRIIAHIGSDNACRILNSKINYHNFEIAYEAAKMLAKIDHKVDEELYFSIYQSVYKLIEIAAWNIAARASLKDDNADMLLQLAIKSEIKQNIEHIFTLLSLVYDTNKVIHIHELVENENFDNGDYAVELLDLIISNKLKPLLYPLLDSSPDSDKIRQLQVYFSIDKIPLNEILIDIINRDFNQINKWTKACALHNILSFPEYSVTNDIVAHVFNNDPLLNEVATCIIDKFDAEKFPEYTKRLDELGRFNMQQILDLKDSLPQQLLFSRITFLKQIECFNSLSSNAITVLANKLVFQKYSQKTILDSVDGNAQNTIFFLISGSVKVKVDGVTYGEYSEGSIFGGVLSTWQTDYPSVFLANVDVEVYTISQQEFDIIIFDYPEIANSVVLSNNWQKIKK